MITRYKDFLKLMEAKHYEYGCVMLEIPFLEEDWKNLTDKINFEDIYTDPEDSTYGKEKYPHLTLLYGLHSEVTLDQIKNCFSGINSIDVEINGIGTFQGEQFDVVKFNVVKNEKLQTIFNNLSKLPNSNRFKDYQPHITISYLRKGTGKKYEDSSFKKEFLGLNKICYSNPNGQKEYFYL